MAYCFSLHSSRGNGRMGKIVFCCRLFYDILFMLPLPILVTGRRCRHGNSHHINRFRRSECSRLLHLQVAWREKRQLSTNENPRELRSLGVFLLVQDRFSHHFAYTHYRLFPEGCQLCVFCFCFFCCFSAHIFFIMVDIPVSFSYNILNKTAERVGAGYPFRQLIK